MYQQIEEPLRVQICSDLLTEYSANSLIEINGTVLQTKNKWE